MQILIAVGFLEIHGPIQIWIGTILTIIIIVVYMVSIQKNLMGLYLVLGLIQLRFHVGMFI